MINIIVLWQTVYTPRLFQDRLVAAGEWLTGL